MFYKSSLYYSFKSQILSKLLGTKLVQAFCTKCTSTFIFCWVRRTSSLRYISRLVALRRNSQLYLWWTDCDHFATCCKSDTKCIWGTTLVSGWYFIFHLPCISAGNCPIHHLRTHQMGDDKLLDNFINKNLLRPHLLLYIYPYNRFTDVLFYWQRKLFKR